MLICKELESKLATAIKTAVSDLDGIEINTSWAVGESGIVRWVRGESDSRAIVSIAIGTASHETYTAPTCSHTATVSLFTRYELDPTGALLAALAERIENLFRKWMSSTYQAAFTALDIAGEFSVDDVGVGGSSSPSVVNGLVTLAFQVTLRGSYLKDLS